MNYIDKVCEVAKSQIGYIEGKGNNTKYGKWYGLNFSPWCAMLVSNVFYTVFGAATPLKGIQSPKGFAGTQLAAAWAKKNKRLYSTPQKGDIVIWRHTPTTGHTGIVVAVNGDKYDVVEGNTNRYYSRTGGAVELHHHRIGDGQHTKLVGFIRPKWPA